MHIVIYDIPLMNNELFKVRSYLNFYLTFIECRN